MLANVSVLIPYKSDHGSRDIIFKWVKNFYEKVMPDVELIIGISNDKYFNRSKAINLAAHQATREVLVIADGDIIFDPTILIDAVGHLNDESWVVPFREVMNITEQATEKLLNQEPVWPLSSAAQHYQIERFYEEFAGKLNVLTKDTFLKVGGFDERFVGWGGEDDAFRFTINTLCKPFKRLDYQLYHLWHPPINWETAPNREGNWQLLEQYKEAAGNKTEILNLLKSRLH